MKPSGRVHGASAKKEATEPRPVANIPEVPLVTVSPEIGGAPPAGVQTEKPRLFTPERPVAAPLSADQQRDNDALAQRILARELFDKRNLPDIGLLPKSGPIFILSSDCTPLTARAFPNAGQRRLRLMSLAELQDQANQSNETVAVVVLDFSITSDTADVSSGVDIVLPSSSTSGKLCCCIRSQDWVKRDGRWKPDPNGRVSTICS